MALDSHFENRERRKVEIRYLEGIRDDLLRDSIAISRWETDLPLALRANHLLLAVLDGEPVPASARDSLVWAVQRSGSGGWTSSRGWYDDLETTRNISVLSNAELRQSLERYYASRRLERDRNSSLNLSALDTYFLFPEEFFARADRSGRPPAEFPVDLDRFRPRLRSISGLRRRLEIQTRIVMSRMRPGNPREEWGAGILHEIVDELSRLGADPEPSRFPGGRPSAGGEEAAGDS